MWELTITYGLYHDLKTLVHRSKNEHDWVQVGDYWHFSGNDDQGEIDWHAIVADVRSSVDVKQVEPATAQRQDEDKATTAPGEDPVSGWVQDGMEGMRLTARGSTRRPAYEAEGQHDPTV